MAGRSFSPGLALRPLGRIEQDVRAMIPQLRLSDPGLGALRSAARAAIVMPAVFAFAEKVIGDPQTATFAAFGSFAILVLVDFTGPMRSRFVAYLGLAFAGALNIILGTFCSRNAWLAAAAMALVGFVILFSGVINGYFAAAGTSALLTFILPVTIPVPFSDVPARLEGWGLAASAGILAHFLLWPARPRAGLRHDAGNASRSLAELQEAELAGDLEAIAIRAEAARDVVGGLRRGYLSAPHRPSGPLGPMAALASLVDELDWLKSFLVPPPDSPSLYVSGEENVEALTATASVLQASAAILAGRGARPDFQRLDGSERCRRRGAGTPNLGFASSHRRRVARFCTRADFQDPRHLVLRQAGGRLRPPRKRQALARPGRAGRRRRGLLQPAARCSGGDRATRGRACRRRIGVAPQQPPRCRGTRRRGLHRPADRSPAFLLGRPRNALGPPLECIEHRVVRAHRARWNRGGDPDRRSPRDRHRNARARSLGGASRRGAARGLCTSGDLVRRRPGRVHGRPLRALQHHSAQGVERRSRADRRRCDRLRDQPRRRAAVLAAGRAATLLRENLAAAYGRSADYVVAMAREIIDETGPGSSAEVAQTAATALHRLDDAFRQYLAERSATGVNLEEVGALVAGAARLRRAAQSLGALGRMAEGDTKLTRCGANLDDEIYALRAWYVTLGDSFLHSTAIPPPHIRDAEGRTRLLECVRAAVSDGGRTNARSALVLVWANQHLDNLWRLESHLGRAAAQATAIRSAAAEPA